MGELPPEVFDILTKAQLYCGGIVVGVSSLMGMVGGLMRTLGMREEGKKRYKDAIIGMSMVLTAPAVITVIATILKAFFPTQVAVAVIGNTAKIFFL